MFVRFNFVKVSTLRNFFNTEIFPIYGRHPINNPEGTPLHARPTGTQL